MRTAGKRGESRMDKPGPDETVVAARDGAGLATDVYRPAGDGPFPVLLGAQPLDYNSDPRNPVPTIGGALSSGEPVMRGGAYDQRKLGERPDVLAFSTPPLERDLEVTGPVTVRLWIASDSPDTDFTAS